MGFTLPADFPYPERWEEVAWIRDPARSLDEVVTPRAFRSPVERADQAFQGGTGARQQLPRVLHQEGK